MRLRGRDLDVLLALAKMRLLRTSELSRLFFGAVGTCQKRLRKLYDAGLVRAIAPDLAAENRYALTALGHALLDEALDGTDVPSFRPAPRVDGRSLAHLDLLNRYRIALAKGVAGVGVELVRFTPEWEIRSREPEAVLVPDAAIVIQLAGRTFDLALEVDVGTEPPMTVRRKAERYEEFARLGRAIAGLREPFVLCVASSVRRAVSLARALSGGAGSDRVAIGAPPLVLGDGGLSRGFASVGVLAAAGSDPAAACGAGLVALVRGGGGAGTGRVSVVAHSGSAESRSRSPGFASRYGSARW